MKLLLDERLSTRLGPLLGEAGHEVAHVNDNGLGGRSDEEVPDSARADGRVLVSADTDFGELVARQG